VVWLSVVGLSGGLVWLLLWLGCCCGLAVVVAWLVAWSGCLVVCVALRVKGRIPPTEPACPKVWKNNPTNFNCLEMK